MKDELINDLIIALMPYVKDTQDLKLAITIVLGKYEVQKAETALTVYEGDINELILKRFIASKIAKGCSMRTIHYYQSTISKTLMEIGKPYMDITADDIRYWLAVRIQRDGITKTTANNERRNLSAFYGWLQKEEILLKNPMLKVDSIKETKRKKKAYSLLDLEKIRIGCRTNRERAIVEFLASTWCRVSEACEVKISDIRREEVVKPKEDIVFPDDPPIDTDDTAPDAAPDGLPAEYFGDPFEEEEEFDPEMEELGVDTKEREPEQKPKKNPVPKKYVDDGKIRALYETGKWTVKDIAEDMGLGQATVYNHLKKMGVDLTK